MKKKGTMPSLTAIGRIKKETHLRGSEKIGNLEFENSSTGQASQQAIEDLKLFLSLSDNSTPTMTIHEQPFALVPLTTTDAEKAAVLLWQHHAQTIRTQRASEIAKQQVTILRANGKPISMKYWSKPANADRNLAQIVAL